MIGKLLRQNTATGQIIEGRDELPLGQVARAAEDDHDAGGRRLSPDLDSGTLHTRVFYLRFHTKPSLQQTPSLLILPIVPHDLQI